MNFRNYFNCPECDPNIPCIKHVVQATDHELNKSEARAFLASQIKEDIDMAGPGVRFVYINHERLMDCLLGPFDKYTGKST